MSQSETVYDRLRAAILAFELAPGERLPERSLEARFSASRTPVRAALQRLEGEGLVTRGERGFAVAHLDLDDVRSLAELRLAIEPAAARLAVERASDAAIAELADALPHPSTAIEGVRAGAELHAALAALGGNRFMAESVRSAMTRLERTRYLEVRDAAAREAAWREHQQILAAIAARDSETAVALLTAHITGTHERLIATLEGAIVVTIGGSGNASLTKKVSLGK
jgi:DNA-binding GntR family transcriptional regulator